MKKVVDFHNLIYNTITKGYRNVEYLYRGRFFFEINWIFIALRSNTGTRFGKKNGLIIFESWQMSTDISTTSRINLSERSLKSCVNFVHYKHSCVTSFRALQAFARYKLLKLSLQVFPYCKHSSLAVKMSREVSRCARFNRHHCEALIVGRVLSTYRKMCYALVKRFPLCFRFVELQRNTFSFA